jgi:hypothetical protein
VRIAATKADVGFVVLAPLVVILSTATLGGCVTEVRYVTPPPPHAYVAEPEVAAQVTVAPPELPEYEQPPCPGEGYLWTPGYWGWGAGGYYWVPGTWVLPPRVGVLWTPGYWGFVGGAYVWHAGYWGPHVGFYGGVNYGFGYGGVGFVGGRWAGNAFAYNQSVTNVNVVNVHNTYNETVINNVTINKVSYNGGPAGVSAAPTARERMAAQEPHVEPTALQRQHVQEAARNPALFAKANGGRPAIAATPRPAAFAAEGVVGAHGAAVNSRAVAFEGNPHETGARPKAPPAKAEAAKAHKPPNKKPDAHEREDGRN